MSTIIDALKRSDRERQINTTHTVSYSHLHEEKSQSRAWVKNSLIILLILAACIFATMSWFNREQAEIGSINLNTNTATHVNAEEPHSSSLKIITPIPDTQIVEEQKPTLSIEQITSPKNNALASIVNSNEENKTKVEMSDSRPSLSEIVITPPPVKTLVASTQALKKAEYDPKVGVLQVSQELVSQYTDFLTYDNYASIRASKNLPELHLDILKYHPTASQRKAFINMQAYKEGEQISEGAELLKIGKKGVLLRYHGTDFVLRTQ